PLPPRRRRTVLLRSGRIRNLSPPSRQFYCQLSLFILRAVFFRPAEILATTYPPEVAEPRTNLRVDADAVEESGICGRVGVRVSRRAHLARNVAGQDCKSGRGSQIGGAFQPI